MCDTANMYKKIRLVDSTLDHSSSIGLVGQNRDEHPESIRWDILKYPSDLAVFTDMRLKEAVNDPAKKKIGILLEPHVVAAESHRVALQLRDIFDVILTHNRKLIETGPPFRFYPFGGSWIKRWGLFGKSKLLSILVGSKNKTEGQRIQHIVADHYKDKGVNVYGQPYTERLLDKIPALRPYYFSIIIENGKEDWFFSEKLIDCLSQGTIPIYWGCPEIGRFFDTEGIIQFNSLKDLEHIATFVSEEEYMKRIQKVMFNMVTALQYRCAEDWIYDKYGEELF